METTLPLDRLIAQILHEHHIVQAAVNAMIDSMEQTQTVDMNDLEAVSYTHLTLTTNREV